VHVLILIAAICISIFPFATDVANEINRLNLKFIPEVEFWLFFSLLTCLTQINLFFDTSSDPKKSRICFFATESLSNLGKGMWTTKMYRKIDLNIFPDFEAS
jgi:hypothetical protein